MFDYLMIRWPDSEACGQLLWQWSAMTREGAVLESGQGDEQQVLACYARCERPPAVVLLASGFDVLLSSVEISSEQRRHLKQVLPFLAEEKLADDIEDVHIGIGPLVKNRPLAIAVVKHVDLINWLDLLYSAGLPPARVVPESLALPWRPGQLSVWVGRDRCLIRDAPMHGMACDLENLPLALRVLHASAEAGAFDAVVIYHPSDPDGVELAGSLARHLHSGAAGGSASLPAIEWVSGEWDLSTVLGAGLARDLPSALNLLQGGYTVDLPDGSGTLNTRKVGIAFAACLLAHLLLTLSLGSWFHHRAQVAKAESVALYRSWFPEARRVFDPKRQLQSRLAAFGEHGSDRLVGYVDGLAAAWQADAVELVSLQFDAPSDTLSLELGAADAESLKRLGQGLATSGFSSELTELTNRGAGVSGRIELGGLL